MWGCWLSYHWHITISDPLGELIDALSLLEALSVSHRVDNDEAVSTSHVLQLEIMTLAL